MTRVYFFGCAAVPEDDGAGHFLYGQGHSAAGIRTVYRDESKETPWTVQELDCGLLEGPRQKTRVYSPGEPQTQGMARLVHKDGWTALSLWDRTGDGRGNSNSALLVEGLYSFGQMTALFEKTFPVLWARITGAGPVTSHPSNPRPAPAPAVEIPVRLRAMAKEDPIDRILAMVDTATTGEQVVLVRDAVVR